MSEPMWHYVRDGEAVGPVSHADLCTLFADKDLSLETLVWHEALPDWLAASAVEDFRGVWGKGFGRRGATPPPLPADAAMLPGPGALPPAAMPPAAPSSTTIRPSLEVRGRFRREDERWDKTPQLRPWIRYWARAVDNQVLFTVAAFVFIPTTFWEFVAYFYGTLLIGALVFFPVQLVLFGRTIGKLVFGIHLEQDEGEPLTLGQAVAREWGVLLNGMGLGLFILPLFTMTNAYRRLMREGATSWDVAGGLLVRHRGVGPGRWAAFLVVGGVLGFLQETMRIPITYADVRNQNALAPTQSMASVVITPTTPHATTQPAGPKKPRAKPKLLTLPGDKGASKPSAKPVSPTTRPARRQDRPPPQVIFKPDPATESN